MDVQSQSNTGTTTTATAWYLLSKDISNVKGRSREVFEKLKSL